MHWYEGNLVLDCLWANFVNVWVIFPRHNNGGYYSLTFLLLGACLMVYFLMLCANRPFHLLFVNAGQALQYQNCKTVSLHLQMVGQRKIPDLFLAHLSWKLKVSFCDHSPSVVVVRMSVRPSTIFKQHLLLNHWLDFDQTSKEWSLVSPLSKLFKWFWSIAYLGHRS